MDSARLIHELGLKRRLSAAKRRIMLSVAYAMYGISILVVLAVLLNLGTIGLGPIFVAVCFVIT